jgi:hypothetical protein
MLWRWREVLLGAGVALLGLWLVLGPGLFLAIPGYALIVGGLGLVALGIQRGRFRGAGGGAGAVQVVEGQIAYFGPLTGGSVALAELQQLSLEGTMFPAHWKLTQAGHPPLLIPVNAVGADALFDAFAALPGLKTEAMLKELSANRHQSVVIWQGKNAPLPPRVLH